MISHVSVCVLAQGEKGLISNTFCHTKREYSFSVRPIGYTPAFLSKIEATLLKARRTHYSEKSIINPLEKYQLRADKKVYAALFDGTLDAGPSFDDTKLSRLSE